MTAGGTRTGAVYDRGYRPYAGPRGGRRAATAALYRVSLRRAVGLRRSWRQKLVPLGLLVITAVPALIEVAVAYVTRDVVRSDQPISYRDYIGVSSSLLLFVAVVAPDLVCPDRRQRVLALIFARPLTGWDYALAKVGAILTCVFAFALLPHVVLFTARVLLSDDALGYVSDNAEVLWQVPVAVAALALYYSVLGVALASLTGRRVVAAASVLGTTLVTAAVAGGLQDNADGGTTTAAVAALVDVAALPLHVRDLVFLGHPAAGSGLEGVAAGGLLAVLAYLAVLVAGVVTLLVRYRPGQSA